jgi:hypothetical protein
VILPKDQATGGEGEVDEEEQAGETIEDDRPICKFFASARGCLRGDRCWFQHVLPNKTPRDKEAAGPKTETQRQTDQLDKELDELPVLTSNATVAANGNGNGIGSAAGLGAAGAAGAAASSGRPVSSPSPNGSPRWAEYHSDWQGYDYYDSNESCGIVGSMVLDAVSSSEEEEEDVQDKPEEQEHEGAEQTVQQVKKPNETTAAAAADTVDISPRSSAATDATQSQQLETAKIDGMRVPELRKALGSKGLDTTGRKAELVSRLQQALA